MNNSFHANVMVASPALEWGYGWKYDKILERMIKGGGENDETDDTMSGNEKYYDPASMTALEFGGVIIEEQRDSTISQGEQTLACYDLSKVDAVKTVVDALAVALYCHVKNGKLTAKFKRSPSFRILERLEKSDDIFYLNISGNKVVLSEKTDNE